MHPIKPVPAPDQPPDTVQPRPAAPAHPRLSAGWIIAWLITLWIAYCLGFDRGVDHQALQHLIGP